MSNYNFNKDQKMEKIIVWHGYYNNLKIQLIIETTPKEKLLDNKYILLSIFTTILTFIEYYKVF